MERSLGIEGSLNPQKNKSNGTARTPNAFSRPFALSNRAASETGAVATGRQKREQRSEPGAVATGKPESKICKAKDPRATVRTGSAASEPGAAATGKPGSKNRRRENRDRQRPANPDQRGRDAEAVSKAARRSIGKRSGLGSCPAVERSNASIRAMPADAKRKQSKGRGTPETSRIAPGRR